MIHDRKRFTVALDGQTHRSRLLPLDNVRAGNVRKLLWLTLVTCSLDFSTPPMVAQENPPIGNQEQVHPTEADVEHPASESQITEWIEMLGSERFAVRERAAIELMREGESVQPALKSLADSTADPEIRLRAKELSRQIERGNADAKIAAFVSGKSDHLDGWGIASRVLGDTGSVRELYVEVFRAHADIASSLEGTSRDRVIAMTAAASRIRNASLKEGRFPTRADAVALLFPLIFEGVPITDGYESFLIDVLQTEAGSLLYKSATLSGPYQRLLIGWARRSGMRVRQDLLWLLMDHDVDQASHIALDTLTQTNDPQTLAIALQAIAKYGTRAQADERITNLLNDDRVIVDGGFVRGKLSRTELGDVATATLAVLYDLPLTEIGFEGASRDPRFGLRPEEVGFEVAKQNKREETRKRVMAKISEINNADAIAAPLLVE